MTNREQEALNAQGHARFSEWAPAEQSAFERERQQMWAGIPAHVRAKAEKLAGH